MTTLHAAKGAHYIAGLHALKEDNRLRSLKPRVGFDFASNDNLGLASAPQLRGARNSRSEAAQCFGAETALFFGGGYVANFAVLTTLPRRDDLLVLDFLVHASIHEDARAGRADFGLAIISVESDPRPCRRVQLVCAFHSRSTSGRMSSVQCSMHSVRRRGAGPDEPRHRGDRHLPGSERRCFPPGSPTFLARTIGNPFSPGLKGRSIRRSSRGSPIYQPIASYWSCTVFERPLRRINRRKLRDSTLTWSRCIRRTPPSVRSSSRARAGSWCRSIMKRYSSTSSSDGAFVVLCTSTEFGTINHSLLSIEALRQRQMSILEVAFIGKRNPESESAICEIGRVRWLGRLPWIAPLTADTLQTVFGSSFVRNQFLNP